MDKPNVIIVVGASGAGTTTLGLAVKQRLACRHIDTDDIFWTPTDPPFTTPREIPERQNLLQEQTQGEAFCVVTGNVCDWGNFLLPRFLLAVHLLTPTEIRIGRLKKREYQNFGERIRPGGDMHEDHTEFVEWAATYDTAGIDTRSLAKHRAWLTQVTCPVLRLEGIDPPEENAERIAWGLGL